VSDQLHMTQEKQVAVVTGNSSGIGFETCLTMARNGYNTYATMRKIEGKTNQITDISKNENLPLKVLQLDVDNDKSVLDAINRIVTEYGSIDVVCLPVVVSWPSSLLLSLVVVESKTSFSPVLVAYF